MKPEALLDERTSLADDLRLEIAPGRRVRRLTRDLYLVHRDVLFETALLSEAMGVKFRHYLEDDA